MVVAFFHIYLLLTDKEKAAKDSLLCCFLGLECYFFFDFFAGSFQKSPFIL